MPSTSSVTDLSRLILRQYNLDFEALDCANLALVYKIQNGGNSNHQFPRDGPGTVQELIALSPRDTSGKVVVVASIYSPLEDDASIFEIDKSDLPNLEWTPPSSYDSTTKCDTVQVYLVNDATGYTVRREMGRHRLGCHVKDLIRTDCLFSCPKHLSQEIHFYRES